MADFYLKPAHINGDLFFDLELSGNTIVSDDSLITAVIISIFTDGSQPNIGEHLRDGIKLGNPAYNINKLSDNNIQRYQRGLESTLQWLIEDGVVSQNTVTTEKQGNRLNINIVMTLDNDNALNVIFSLDENLELIDDTTRA